MQLKEAAICDLSVGSSLTSPLCFFVSSAAEPCYWSISARRGWSRESTRRLKARFPSLAGERIVVAGRQVTQQEPADVAGGTGTGSHWNRTARLVGRDVQHAGKKNQNIQRLRSSRFHVDSFLLFSRQN